MNSLDSRYALYINGKLNDYADFPNGFLDTIEGYPDDECIIVYQKYIDFKWVYLYTVDYVI